MAYIVDDYGDIKQIPDGAKVRIYTVEELAERRRKAELIKMPKSEQFVKIYSYAIDELVRLKLTSSEMTVFLYLADNARYESNVAKYGNGVLITRELLCQDLNIPLVTMKRCITTLIRKGLIAEAKTIHGRVFVVNPFVCQKGDKVEPTTYDLFKKTKWAIDFGRKS